MIKDTFWEDNPHIYNFIENGYLSLKDFEISKQISDTWHISIDPEKIRNLRRKEGWKKRECNNNEHFEKALVITCLHAPYHDKKLFKLFLQFLKYFKPNYIFMLGDMNDWYTLSKFSQNPKRLNSLNDELESIHNLLKQIHQVSPASKKKLTIGNHEERLRKYLWSHPEIASLEKEYLNIPQLLKLKDCDVTYSEKGFDYHGIYLFHGHRLSKYSAYSAKLAMDDNTCNLIQGHSHRGGTHYKTVWRGGKPKQYVAHEAFCMCDLKPEYIERPNWQQGWICIYTNPKSNYFQIEPVCVVDYKFEFEGRMFIG